MSFTRSTRGNGGFVFPDWMYGKSCSPERRYHLLRKARGVVLTSASRLRVNIGLCKRRRQMAGEERETLFFLKNLLFKDGDRAPVLVEMCFHRTECANQVVKDRRRGLTQASANQSSRSVSLGQAAFIRESNFDRWQILMCALLEWIHTFM